MTRPKKLQQYTVASNKAELPAQLHVEAVQKRNEVFVLKAFFTTGLRTYLLFLPEDGTSTKQKQLLLFI